jgi:hypothetical protein
VVRVKLPVRLHLHIQRMLEFQGIRHVYAPEITRWNPSILCS